MIQRLLLLAALLLTCPVSEAGSRDPIQDGIDTTVLDTSQLRKLIELAEQRGHGGRNQRYLLTLAERFSEHSNPAVRELAVRGRAQYLLWLASDEYERGNYRGSARYAEQARHLALSVGDQRALAFFEIRMSNLYGALADTLNELRHGYRSAELFLLVGDSVNGADVLMGMARMDTSKTHMRSAIAFGDRYFQPRDTPQELGTYLWYRAWILTGHGYYAEAIQDLLRADSLLSNETNGSRNLNFWTLGEAYQHAGRSREAIEAFRKCIAIGEEHIVSGFRCGCRRDLGNELMKIGDLAGAEEAWRAAGATTGDVEGFIQFRISALAQLKDLLRDQGRHAEAIDVYEQWSALRDSAERADASLDLMRHEFNAEQRADSLLNVQRQEAADHQLHRERNNRNLLLAAAVVAVVFGSISYRQRRRTQKALQRSDELLLNILPEEVAEELKATGAAEAVHLDQVTVLFTDFKGFTAMSEVVTPRQLVHDLHECFSAFDRICEKNGIEKIKTIGDAYMAAGGLPTPNTTHATDVTKAALEMRDFIAEGKARKVAAGLPYFEIRIGIHTGPVVAGIVGVKKFQYDIWGDTVNTASRMESSGEVGQVNISEATYRLLVAGCSSSDDPPTKNEQPTTTFTFIPRGKVQAKGKGEMEMYFVTST